MVGLPRRTIQYWHDKGVIIPINLEPLVYSDNEVRLSRILAAMYQSKPSIQFVGELSKVLSLCLEGDGSVPEDVAKAFSAAAQGEKAYLILRPQLIGKMVNDFWIWAFGAVGLSEMQNTVAEQLSDEKHRNLQISVIDLTYCFDLGSAVGGTPIEKGD